MPLYGIEHAHGHLLFNADGLEAMTPAVIRVYVWVLHNLTHESIDLISRGLHRLADANVAGFGVYEDIAAL